MFDHVAPAPAPRNTGPYRRRPHRASTIRAPPKPHPEEDERRACAVRPVKAAGAEPWKQDRGGRSRGNPGVRRKSEACRARHAAPETRPSKEPDAADRWFVSDQPPPPLALLATTKPEDVTRADRMTPARPSPEGGHRRTRAPKGARRQLVSSDRANLAYPLADRRGAPAASRLNSVTGASANTRSGATAKQPKEKQQDEDR
jgi:hypothetical protein